MLSKERLAAMKYLKTEYNKLQNDPILSLGCTVGLVNNDIFHWKISLLGPQDTPYAGGMFFLTADFTDQYPQSKPEVRFTNKIYHLNVSPSNGHICISTLINGNQKLQWLMSFLLFLPCFIVKILEVLIVGKWQENMKVIEENLIEKLKNGLKNMLQ